MREKNLKRGPFLNFLYITIQRLLQKQEHMIKSFSFLLRKEELFLQKRNSWQVCLSLHCLFAETHLGPDGTRLEQNAQARLKAYKHVLSIHKEKDTQLKSREKGGKKDHSHSQLIKLNIFTVSLL